MPRRPLSLAILLCASLAAGEDDPPTATLRARHDELRAALEARAVANRKAGDAHDFALVLDGAVADATVTLELSRRQGVWCAPRLTGLPADVVLLGLDISGLELSGDRVAGTIAVTWARRRWETIDGGRWERDAGPAEDFAPREQEIAINAAWRREHLHYRLELVDGVPGKSSLVVELERAPDAPVRAMGQARRWNRAVHDVDPSGLTIDVETIAGDLPVVLRPDKWVPNDHRPRKQAYALDCRIAGGAVSGSYTGSGEVGEAAGEVTGSVRQALEGWYATENAAGARRGPIDGRVAAAGTVLDAEAPAEADAARLYAEIQALALVLRSHPRLALSEARARVRHLPPSSLPEGGREDYRRLLAAYAASTAPFPHRGGVRPDDPRFGPYCRISELPVEDLNGGTLPERADADSTWFRVAGWRLVEFTAPKPAVEPPVLPELVVMPGCTWPVAPGAEESAGAQEGTFFRSGERLGGDNAKKIRPDPRVRYGLALVEAQADTEAWLAIKADDGGCLWLNHRPVWCSRSDDGSYDRHRWAIVPVHLRRGANRFLARSVAVWGAQDFRLRIQINAGPRAEHDDPPAAVTLPRDWRGFRGDGTACYPDADPPLAWDWEAGTNLVWQQALPPGHGAPTLWHDCIFVTAEPTSLICFAATDGEELWRHDKSDVTGRNANVPACTTPLAHGDAVYAFFGDGQLRCHGLDGALRWVVASDLTCPSHNAPAPVLIGERLVLQAYATGGEGGAVAIGVDPATGRLLWRTELPTRERTVRFVDGKWDSSWREDGAADTVNGLAGMRLTDGESFRDLAISSAGHVIDVADGRLLHHAEVAPLTRAAPQVVEDTAHFASVMGASALRLWLTGEGRVACRPLWLLRRRLYSTGASTSVGSRRFWYRGPLHHEGLLYVQRTKWNHWPMHHPKPWTEVSAYDPESGYLLGVSCPVMRKAANAAGQPTRAGNYIFFVDGGGEPAPSSGHARDESRLCPAIPGHPVQGLVANRVGPLRSCPVFAGERLYLRTDGALTCIAVADEAGARFQEERLAEELLVRIPPKPRPAPVREIAPDTTNYFEVEGVPVWPIVDHAAPDRWLFCGPLPLEKGVDPLQALGGEAAARPAPGTALAEGDDAPSFVPIPRDFIRIRYNVIVHWSSKPPTSCALDLMRAAGGEQNTRCYYYTVVYVPSPCTVALAVKNRGAAMSAWLAGEPITPDNPVRLRTGLYPLLLRADLGRLPPFIRQVVIEPQFREQEDAMQQLSAWREEVRRLRPRLERVVAELPGSEWSKKAELVLKGLEQR